MTIVAATLASPVGPLAVEGTLTGRSLTLTALRFGARHNGDPTPFASLATQLDEFFAGARTQFDVPMAPSGTPFQVRVWTALQDIPFGQTRSYTQIAVAIGSPAATRAVGAANGRNPLSIVVPCHRVVGADGSLTGFGGGLPIKRWLLDHERAVAGESLF